MLEKQNDIDAVVMVLLGNIAVRLQDKLYWDGEKITKDELISGLRCRPAKVGISDSDGWNNGNQIAASAVKATSFGVAVTIMLPGSVAGQVYLGKFN